jgi:hypothetical protein
MLSKMQRSQKKTNGDPENRVRGEPGNVRGLDTFGLVTTPIVTWHSPFPTLFLHCVTGCP